MFTGQLSLALRRLRKAQEFRAILSYTLDPVSNKQNLGRGDSSQVQVLATKALGPEFRSLAAA